MKEEVILWIIRWGDPYALECKTMKKHEQLLKQLGEKDRVFSLEWNEENITLMECCDYCFGHDLTKEECKELSEVFRELAEELGK